MKKIITVIALIAALASYDGSAQLLNKLKKEASKLAKGSSSPFSSEEAANAIKEALVKGTSKGTDFLSQTDGFFKNPEVKIPFPPEAKKVEKTLRDIGLGNQADRVILSLNRAAEDAAKSAKDIFVTAITKMTLEDAINIVKGNDNAATEYLKRTTTTSLTEAFSPIIEKSLEKTDATKYWGDAMTAYNKVPLVKKVNPDLKAYVTQKSLDALFLMIAKEELEIRKDPMARTSDLLKKVFGK